MQSHDKGIKLTVQSSDGDWVGGEANEDDWQL